ncbi:Nicotinamide/nicotinic acid mononucleotide adenylyltransferase [Coccomyxa sp. Obi]|nr:Nicotinamide/nicotinic acid mononucleotide adenylyltransferase [Coccomyxa sp. Obi]
MLSAVRRVAAASVAGYTSYCLLSLPGQPSESQCEGQNAGTSTPCIIAATHEKSWLEWGRSIFGGSRGPSLKVATALPTDKLSCKRAAQQPGAPHKPVVLLSCGSFNPPTYAHLRMFELAAQELIKEGYDVLGGYMSPVHDAYNKKGLASAHHRVAMCQLAADTSPLIMVDSWEAAQEQYQYSLHVLQHLEHAVNDACCPNNSEVQNETGTPGHSSERSGVVSTADTAGVKGRLDADVEQTRVRSILLCGADMVESLTVPGVWRPDHVRHILQDHGLVCIGRTHSDVRRLMADPASVLHEFQHNIILVEDPIPNEISSTKIRSEMCKGHTVRYLLPDAVIDYIQKERLYC